MPSLGDTRNYDGGKSENNEHRKRHKEHKRHKAAKKAKKEHKHKSKDRHGSPKLSLTSTELVKYDREKLAKYESSSDSDSDDDSDVSPKLRQARKDPTKEVIYLPNGDYLIQERALQLTVLESRSGSSSLYQIDRRRDPDILLFTDTYTLPFESLLNTDKPTSSCSQVQYNHRENARGGRYFPLPSLSMPELYSLPPSAKLPNDILQRDFIPLPPEPRYLVCYPLSEESLDAHTRTTTSLQLVDKYLHTLAKAGREALVHLETGGSKESNELAGGLGCALSMYASNVSLRFVLHAHIHSNAVSPLHLDLSPVTANTHAYSSSIVAGLRDRHLGILKALLGLRDADEHIAGGVSNVEGIGVSEWNQMRKIGERLSPSQRLSIHALILCQSPNSPQNLDSVLSPHPLPLPQDFAQTAYPLFARQVCAHHALFASEAAKLLEECDSAVKKPQARVSRWDRAEPVKRSDSGVDAVVADRLRGYFHDGWIRGALHGVWRVCEVERRGGRIHTGIAMAQMLLVQHGPWLSPRTQHLAPQSAQLPQLWDAGEARAFLFGPSTSHSSRNDTHIHTPILPCLEEVFAYAQPQHAVKGSDASVLGSEDGKTKADNKEESGGSNDQDGGRWVYSVPHGRRILVPSRDSATSALYAKHLRLAHSANTAELDGEDEPPEAPSHGGRKSSVLEKLWSKSQASGKSAGKGDVVECGYVGKYRQAVYSDWKRSLRVSNASLSYADVSQLLPPLPAALSLSYLLPAVLQLLGIHTTHTPCHTHPHARPSDLCDSFYDEHVYPHLFLIQHLTHACSAGAAAAWCGVRRDLLGYVSRTCEQLAAVQVFVVHDYLLSSSEDSTAAAPLLVQVVHLLEHVCFSQPQLRDQQQHAAMSGLRSLLLQLYALRFQLDHAKHGARNNHSSAPLPQAALAQEVEQRAQQVVQSSVCSKNCNNNSDQSGSGEGLVEVGDLRNWAQLLRLFACTSGGGLRLGDRLLRQLHVVCAGVRVAGRPRTHASMGGLVRVYHTLLMLLLRDQHTDAGGMGIFATSPSADPAHAHSPSSLPLRLLQSAYLLVQLAHSGALWGDYGEQGGGVCGDYDSLLGAYKSEVFRKDALLCVGARVFSAEGELVPPHASAGASARRKALDLSPWLRAAGIAPDGSPADTEGLRPDSVGGLAVGIFERKVCALLRAEGAELQRGVRLFEQDERLRASGSGTSGVGAGTSKRMANVYDVQLDLDKSKDVWVLVDLLAWLRALQSLLHTLLHSAPGAYAGAWRRGEGVYRGALRMAVGHLHAAFRIDPCTAPQQATDSPHRRSLQRILRSLRPPLDQAQQTHPLLEHEHSLWALRQSGDLHAGHASVEGFLQGVCVCWQRSAQFLLLLEEVTQGLGACRFSGINGIEWENTGKGITDSTDIVDMDRLCMFPPLGPLGRDEVVAQRLCTALAGLLSFPYTPLPHLLCTYLSLSPLHPLGGASPLSRADTLGAVYEGYFGGGVLGGEGWGLGGARVWGAGAQGWDMHIHRVLAMVWRHVSTPSPSPQATKFIPTPSHIYAILPDHVFFLRALFPLSRNAASMASQQAALSPALLSCLLPLLENLVLAGQAAEQVETSEDGNVVGLGMCPPIFARMYVHILLLAAGASATGGAAGYVSQQVQACMCRALRWAGWSKQVFRDALALGVKVGAGGEDGLRQLMLDQGMELQTD
eukprot:gene27970-33775_t